MLYVDFCKTMYAGVHNLLAQLSFRQVALDQRDAAVALHLLEAPPILVSPRSRYTHFKSNAANVKLGLRNRIRKCLYACG